MNFLEAFTNVAIMLIYPNGMVDKLFIDDENLLHMKYFRKLSNTSTYFFELLKANNIQITNKKGELLDISTYYLDTLLTNLGVIVIRNCNILDIKNNESFLEYNFPEYAFSIPNIEKITLEQKNIIGELFNEYNFQSSLFFYNAGNTLEDSSYDNMVDILNINKSR